MTQYNLVCHSLKNILLKAYALSQSQHVIELGSLRHQEKLSN